MVMIGYLTSYMKESPFVLFANGASNSCNGASNSWPQAPFKIYPGQV